jgi:predicted transcriptional regulator
MLLLSIRPKYVDTILAGEKRVELRRRSPRVKSGPALIYATAPRMELVAAFRVASVIHVPLSLLWQSVRDIAGVTRDEFDAYFHGLKSGVGIRIADVAAFRTPIPLDDLRTALKGFHPPQGFRYLDWADVAKLGIGGLRQAA